MRLHLGGLRHCFGECVGGLINRRMKVGIFADEFVVWESEEWLQKYAKQDEGGEGVPNGSQNPQTNGDNA